MKRVAVLGSFDDLRSGDIRFLEEASKLGELTAFVRGDEAVSAVTGKPPKFPAEERLYVVSAIKYVSRARIVSGRKDEAIFIPLKSSSASSPGSERGDDRFDIWVVSEADALPEWKAAASSAGIEFRVIRKNALRGFPGPSPFLTAEDLPSGPGRSKKKAIVTGCYDFFHSGHVRFFEEASAYGDLYVDVGSDANIRLLKGGGHPLFPEAERLYMVRAVRHVHRAFIGTGVGWMDAAPEIELLEPDFYVVNEDGDRPEKREFCAARKIEYVVLRRAPAPGLPRRDSTTLRGF